MVDAGQKTPDTNAVFSEHETRFSASAHKGRQHLKATLEGLLLRAETRRWAS